MLLAQVAGGVVLNFFMNGAAAWLTFPPVPSLPFWTRGNCAAFDTLGTSFFLPLVTCLVLTPLTRRSLSPRGAVPALDRAALPSFARWLPANMLARGAALGALSMATVAHATILAGIALGAGALGRGDMALYKAVYTAILGGLVTPLLGLRALADAER
jgi:hypothetical protein